jgi:hypothetical protein
MLVFNPLSWAQGGVVEVDGDALQSAGLSSSWQLTTQGKAAFWVEAVPSLGYGLPGSKAAAIPHPAKVSREAGFVTLSNGLAAVTLDAARGGTFGSLSMPGEPGIELLAGRGDDLVYLDDSGDVYGARFDQERARQSQAPARVVVLAEGPLLARVQVTFSLQAQPITKTITLRAGSPLVEVALQMKALAETSALMHTRTAFQTTTRTDDLGFAALEHPIDARPILPGDVTYRRKIFYPVMYWSDISAGGQASA